MNSGKECHVSLGPFCRNDVFTEMTEEYLKAYIAHAELHHPTLALDNEDIKKMLYPDYVAAKAALGDASDEDRFGLYLFLGIAVGAVLVIAVLLLIIYLKRRGSEDSLTEGDDN